VREQQADHLLVAFDRRAVERSEFLLLSRMDVRAARQQLPDDLEPSAGDRGVERRDASAVFRGLARVGAAVEEQARGFRASEEGSEPKRRESVGRERIRPGRILGDQLAKPLGVSDGARFEDVERRPSVAQNPLDCGLAVIDGGQERRDAGFSRTEKRRISVEEFRHLVRVPRPDRIEQPADFVHTARIIGAVRDFGLKPSEAARLRRLSPPWRIQKFLDELDYDVRGEGCRSPRRVLSERKVQCMDGALFAAGALRVQGERPLILDLEAVQDDDHVVALYRVNGLWGSVARSNYSGLRFREPLFATVRELVLSYVEGYFNLRREKTLRRFSRPFDVSRFDRIGWMTAEDDLWEIPNHLVGIRHYRLLTPAQERALAPVSKVVFEAGLVGRKKS
jgi:hypothetical protein